MKFHHAYSSSYLLIILSTLTVLCEKAKANFVPKRLDNLLKVITMDHHNEELVDPMDRKSLNPFLIPISRKKDNRDDMLCFIRWPTMKEDMDLQLVRNTEVMKSLL